MPLFSRPLPHSPSYVYSMIDVPGVVAANNFLSIFNPANSGVVHFPLEVGFTCYAIASVQVPNSLALYRTTAASGGTAVAAVDVHKFQTVLPDAKAALSINNPTATLLSNTPIVFKAPVASAGGGNSGTVTVVTPVPGPLALALLPGEGLVFRTAAGSTNELWSIGYSWAESTA